MQTFYPEFTKEQLETADLCLVALGHRTFDQDHFSAVEKLKGIGFGSFTAEQLETSIALQRASASFSLKLFQYAEAYRRNVGHNEFDKRDLTAVQNILRRGQTLFTAADVQAEKEKSW